MAFLDYLERRLTDARPTTIVVALVALYILKAGIWAIPSITDLSILSHDPFLNPYAGEAQIIFENWFGAFLAWSLGASDPWAFTILHAAFSAAFLAFTVLGLMAAVPEAERRKAVCIFAFFPVFWVPWYWVGYDSLTLALLAAALLLLARPLAVLSIGILVGLQHYQQGAIAFGVLFFVAADGLLRDGQPRRHALAALAGVVGDLIGHQVLKAVMRANHIHFDFDRHQWLVRHWDEIVHMNLALFPNFAYGILGFGWIVLLRYLDGGSNRLKAVAAVLICAVVAGLTTDTTRVFSVISFPALCWLVMRDVAWLRGVPARQIAVLGLLWIATPWLYRWGETYRTTVMPYDVEVVLNAVTGWPDLPPSGSPQRALMPFR